MQVKRISSEASEDSISSYRPYTFEAFIGQENTKKVLHSAIVASQKLDQTVWHILLSWQSGFGKTTLANIVAHQRKVGFKVITAYAISKPADMISLLNTLDSGDVLFIDEIHRLKPAVEEVLYIAMEDSCIDMVMPDGWTVRVPLDPFTLIGATTKMEALSTPLKNRFVYKFHLEQYTYDEKLLMVTYYLKHYSLKTSWEILHSIAEHVVTVPREIVNFCHQVKDYLVSEYDLSEDPIELTGERWNSYLQRSKITKWWLTTLHQSYISVLREADGNPVWLKTLSVKLGIHEKSIEDDVEPLLFELGKIEKTTRWRVLL